MTNPFSHIPDSQTIYKYLLPLLSPGKPTYKEEDIVKAVDVFEIAEIHGLITTLKGLWFMKILGKSIAPPAKSLKKIKK